MKKQFILTVVLLWGLCSAVSAQKAAVKTNLLHGATATPNLALEFGMGRKTSLELYGGYNWFDWESGKKWKHYIVQPEFRWWFCERFARSFVGLHLHAGEFNVGGTGPFTILKNNRYEGWFYGAGVSFGHQWILGKRWGLEAEIGVGYARMEYDRFPCGNCQPKNESGHYNYFGPTRVSLALVYYLW